MTNISEKFIVSDAAPETAGAISYWRLGGSVRLADLAQAWVAAGLPADQLPSEPSDKIGLSRALREVETATRRAIAIKGGDFAGGWGLVDVITTDGNVSTRQVLRVKRGATDKALNIVVDPAYEYEDSDAVADPISGQLRRAYGNARAELAATDVSQWLIDLALRAGAVSLRESGGVYFIPRDAVDRWATIAGVVASVSTGRYDVFRIPALQTQEAVEAILASLEAEANNTIAAFEADLIKAGDDALGIRALAKRTRDAQELGTKLGKYEALLGVKLDTVRTTLETVQANLQAAEWALQAERDAAPVAVRAA